MGNIELTPLVQAAIIVLQYIANNDSFCDLKDKKNFTDDYLSELLLKLEAKGLIRLKDGYTEGASPSYELTQPMYLITLLDVIEAVGETIDYECFIPKGYFRRKGSSSDDPEAIKRIIRGYLETFKLSNLKKNKKQYEQI